jgi:hypothetical protein
MDPSFPFHLPPELQLEVLAYAASLDEAVACFRAACAQGSTRLARRLADLFGLRLDDDHKSRALGEACRGGHLETARWLADRFGLTPDDARAGNNRALRVTCARGQLETVRWLFGRFGLTGADAQAGSSHALRSAAAGAHLASVCWLVARLGLQAPARWGEPARWVAGGGRVTITRWLFGRCIHPTGPWLFWRGALIEASHSGHQRVAGWLIARGDPTEHHQNVLTAASAGGHLSLVCRLAIVSAGLGYAGEAVRAALLDGRAALARWLAERFGLASVGALPDRSVLLSEVCENGHLRAVRWLCRQAIAAADVRTDHGRALGWAMGVHLGLACWFAARFAPSPSDPSPGLTIEPALRGALRGLNRGPARWLAGRAPPPSTARFSLTPACKHGCIATARWMFGHLAAVGEAWADRVSDACEGGHVGIAHWLSAQARTGTGGDISPALKSVGFTGFLGVARWLMGRFGAAAPGMLHGARQALAQASRHNRSEVVYWLLSASILNGSDVRARGCYVLRRARMNGDMALVRWLIETFDLSRADEEPGPPGRGEPAQEQAGLSWLREIHS